VIFIMYEWAKELNCAITVCDTKGTIIYMNDKSKATFSLKGDLIGKNLIDCHKASSWNMIQKMLKEGCSNSYTIHKNGIKKMIYQTPWYENGVIGGLVELSMVIPEEMPLYER
jgi:transcriptional regulator with PAS, ATPase and Fis domain